MSMSVMLIITYVVFSVAALPWCFSMDQQYEECLSALKCGSSVFPNITYPFWGINKSNYCGQSSFQLSCEDDEENLILPIGNHLTLRVISRYLENQTITVADESWLDGNCPAIWNFTGHNQFTLNPSTQKIDLFDCFGRHPITSLSHISCGSSNGSQKTYHVFGPFTNSSHGCAKAGEIPMLESSKIALHYSYLTLGMALKEGFGLRYTIEEENCRDCTSSKGICGSESDSASFQCLCQDKPHKVSCGDDQGES